VVYKWKGKKAIYLYWDNERVNKYAFRADLIINNKLLIEVKSIEALADVHFKQVNTYLKVTGIKLGLIINFNVALIKYGIKRIVNGLELKST
jgi:GxxExxY protein